MNLTNLMVTTPMMTNTNLPTLIVIVGPTGSGKTDVSIELAEYFSAPIISTDSRQVFKGLPIGTAQPSEEQLTRVKHYFIADREITDEYTCGMFEKEALELLEKLFKTHDYVVAVGGSGLYVDALCNGLDQLPLADGATREQLSYRLEHNGIDDLLKELRELDEDYYNQVDRHNPARVMRALEVCLVSGRPYSQQRKCQKAERPFRIVKIGINMNREILYDRINRRVDMMIEAGLEQEARAVYPHRSLNSLQTVGYKEMFEYFDGNISYEEAVELIKRNSRRYAKRQLTWFNRDKEIEWFENKEIKKMQNFLEKFAEK